MSDCRNVTAGEGNGKRETKDLYLAAYLKLNGHKLTGARVEGNRTVFFCFGDSPQLREEEIAYWERREKVIPRDWLDQIRAIRSLADEHLREISDERRPRANTLRHPA